MRLVIDCDGVLFPFIDTFSAYLARRLNINSIPPATHWHFYRRTLALTDEQFTTLMREAVLDEDLFAKGDIPPDASEALWKLSDSGHTIIVATDRLVPGAEREAKEQTRAWLRHAHIPYDSLEFTADKLSVNPDVLLEDRPGAVATARLAGVEAVLWCRPWNDWFPYPRVKSWAEFVKFVEDRDV